MPDRHGGLFVGTENGGICLLNMRSGRFTRFSADVDDEGALSSGSVWSMQLDDQGILWVGTYDGGVNVLSPQAQRFESMKARTGPQGDSHVSALLEDHVGNLWIGTDGGGSVRIPAGFCGLVGFKPSFGRVPQTPGFPGWDHVGTTGPLTRTVRDAAAVLDVIALPAVVQAAPNAVRYLTVMVSVAVQSRDSTITEDPDFL